MELRRWTACLVRASCTSPRERLPFFFFFPSSLALKKKNREHGGVGSISLPPAPGTARGPRAVFTERSAVLHADKQRSVAGRGRGEAPLCSTGRAGAKRQLRAPRPGTAERPGALLRTVSRQGLPRVPLEGDRQLPLSRGAPPPPHRVKQREEKGTGLRRGCTRRPPPRRPLPAGDNVTPCVRHELAHVIDEGLAGFLGEGPGAPETPGAGEMMVARRRSCEDGEPATCSPPPLPVRAD